MVCSARWSVCWVCWARIGLVGGALVLGRVCSARSAFAGLDDGFCLAKVGVTPWSVCSARCSACWVCWSFRRRFGLLRSARSGFVGFVGLFVGLFNDALVLFVRRGQRFSWAF